MVLILLMNWTQVQSGYICVLRPVMSLFDRRWWMISLCACMHTQTHEKRGGGGLYCRWQQYIVYNHNIHVVYADFKVMILWRLISESVVGRVECPVCSLSCSSSYDFSPDVFIMQHLEKFKILLLAFISVFLLEIVSFMVLIREWQKFAFTDWKLGATKRDKAQE
jgi:hypothetical protein